MRRLLDTAAVGLSGICIAHCLLLPVIAVLLPFLGAFSRAEWVHWVFVGVAAPIAVIAIGPLLLETPRAWGLPLAAAAGVGLLLAGALNFPSSAWGTGLTVAGGALLATAHLLNQRRLFDSHRALHQLAPAAR
ncbi:MAG: MerC domain-containing protein [Pseudomonadota bacterium]